MSINLNSSIGPIPVFGLGYDKMEATWLRLDSSEAGSYPRPRHLVVSSWSPL